ncbi:MAG: SNF2-related protein [Proteobacteria bacterium]|nr:SNF2-related protein [Pseudomonadota bacterium]
MTAPHPIHRRLLAEELTLRRRAREQERYAASQRRGRIDLNPHQIDAVIFALERIPLGGCILADEVGLGKTIEAGLVIAQLLAEGVERILIIVPKPLLGQWQNELYALFGIEAGEADLLDKPGVVLIGREFAGSERGAARLRAAPPFGLCVIDEAHEIFAGIHKRYDRGGQYRDDASQAILAHRVRTAVGETPKLLLTATPIQNSLAELWGLVQYVEPTGTLLGNLATFRELFCAGDDRTLAPGQAGELRRRLTHVVKRTLRRQAQEFLERPFVNRQAKLYEYEMSADERSLYEDVTRYLLDPDVCAFSGNNRQFLLIGFHRRMASSRPALADSLENVEKRLTGYLELVERASKGSPTEPDSALGQLAFDLSPDDPDFASELADELGNAAERELDGALGQTPESAGPLYPPDKLRAERSRVRDFIQRARSIAQDSKADRLLEEVDRIAARGDGGTGSGKLVIFTESLITQEYLRQRLVAHGLTAEAITLFRGNNESARAQQALRRWRDEMAIPAHRQPSTQVAMRLALVHEFRTRSRVFIATEAGAKGLNLQFCEHIINYDLPWNPQRIEQRIGRCHRYSQTRDVTVVNFIARDNQAERLLFDILSTKLDLFGTVFDASDAVLHQATTQAPEPVVSALGADIDLRLRRIYQRARTMEELRDQLAELRDQVEQERHAFDEVMKRTYGLIETHFDDRVQSVFRHIRDHLPRGLAELDNSLDTLVCGFLAARDIPFVRRQEDHRIVLELSPSPELPAGLDDGIAVTVGQPSGGEESLYLGHPLVAAALDEARSASDKPFCVKFWPAGDSQPELLPYRGRRGRIAVETVRYRGHEPVDRLIVVGVLEAVSPAGQRAELADPNRDGQPIPAEHVRALLGLPVEDIPPLHPPLRIAAEAVDDAVQEALFLDQSQVEEIEQEHFDRMIDQIECFISDRVSVLVRRREVLQGRIFAARNQRDAALASDRRSQAEASLAALDSELLRLEQEITRLTDRDDPEYQSWRARAHQLRYAQPERIPIMEIDFAVDNSVEPRGAP